MFTSCFSRIVNQNVYRLIVKATVSSYYNAKQKHLGCKKVRGQSEATLQAYMRNQKV